MATTDTVTKLQDRQNGAAEAATEVLTSHLPGEGETILVRSKHGEERAYVIEELTADAFLQAGSIVADNAEAFAEAGLFNEDAWKGLDTGDWGAIATRLAKVWKQVPDAVWRLIAAMLGVDEEEDDVAYLRRNLKLSQVPQVLTAFMAANPWRDLIDSFFRAGQEIGEAISEIRERSPQS